MSQLQSKTNNIVVENSPDKIQVWKSTKSNNSKSILHRVMVLEHFNGIYLPMKFQVSSLNTFWVMLRTKIKNENKQRAITPNIWSFELWFLCIALFRNRIYLPMNFQVSSLNTFWVMPRTKIKNENDQRAITPKVWSFELWFLCTALLRNEVYLPMKFYVDALHSFKVMLRTKKDKRTDRRTDWLTDGRTGA